MKRTLQNLALAAAVTALATTGAQAASINGKNITLRVGSGHADNITYVGQIGKFFIPRVVDRVAKETDYKIKFREHYAGTVVNVFDTLEGTQDGRLDIGAWCVCFDDDKAMGMNLTYFVPFHHPDATVNIKIMRHTRNTRPSSKSEKAESGDKKPFYPEYFKKISFHQDDLLY